MAAISLPLGNPACSGLLTSPATAEWVTRSHHRPHNNFPSPARKIVILHRRQWLSGYLLGWRTLRRLSLSFLGKVFLFSFLGHERSPLVFGLSSKPNVNTSDQFPMLRGHLTKPPTERPPGSALSARASFLRAWPPPSTHGPFALVGRECADRRRGWRAARTRARSLHIRGRLSCGAPFRSQAGARLVSQPPTPGECRSR
jgi:hypothetical protein